MLRTSPCDAPGKDLPSFRDKTSYEADVFIVNVYFVRAETADFFLYRAAAAELPGRSRSGALRPAAGRFMK